MAKSLTILSLLLFSTLCSAQTEQPVVNYAIVIGIDEYKDPKINSLSFAVSDASAIAQLLIKDYSYEPKNVTTLLNAKAKKKAISAAIQRYSHDKNVAKNSQLLIYFGGPPRRVIDTDDNLEKSYFLTNDSVVGNEQETAIDMNDIQILAESFLPKHTLLLFDFSSPNISLRKIDNGFENDKSIEIITACKLDETASESATFQHSVFTKSFLEALSDKTSDTNYNLVISTAGLFGFLQQRVPYFANSIGIKQTPQYVQTDLNTTKQFVFRFEHWSTSR